MSSRGTRNRLYHNLTHTRDLIFLQVWNWGRLVITHDTTINGTTFVIDNKIQFLFKTLVSKIIAVSLSDDALICFIHITELASEIVGVNLTLR